MEESPFAPLFSIAPIEGAEFCHKEKLGNSSIMIFDFRLPPPSHDVKIIGTSLTSTRTDHPSAQISAVCGIKKLKLMGSIGEKNFLTLGISPTPTSILNLKTAYSGKMILMTSSIEARTEYVGGRIRFEAIPMKSWENLEIFAFSYLRSSIISLSIYRSRNSIESHNALSVQASVSPSSSIRGTLVNGKNTALEFEYVKQANQDWTIGTQMKINSRLSSSAKVAWMANIKSSIVESSISSDAEVTTKFTHGLGGGSTFSVYGSANHRSQSFKFGFRMTWDPQSEK